MIQSHISNGGRNKSIVPAIGHTNICLSLSNRWSAMAWQQWLCTPSWRSIDGLIIVMNIDWAQIMIRDENQTWKLNTEKCIAHTYFAYISNFWKRRYWVQVPCEVPRPNWLWCAFSGRREQQLWQRWCHKRWDALCKGDTINTWSIRCHKDCP